MGSGDWFKTVISFKKVKDGCSKQAKKSKSSAKLNALEGKNNQTKESASFANGATSGNPRFLGMSVEDIAAIRIQTAFRACRARKNLGRLKGAVRLQSLTQGFPVKKQATSTLGYLHSWCKIQAEIRARRLCMVTEGRIKQKKLENQRKLEAKLRDDEVEWCGGSETMEEILARIQEREEAAVKRERTMAYAFSHQWRANSSQNYGLGKDELGKSNWGWSWTERWIAARPWEIRISSQSNSPNKVTSKQSSKVGKNANSPKTPISAKQPPSNGKVSVKARRLSYPSAEKLVPREGSAEVEESNCTKETSAS